MFFGVNIGPRLGSDLGLDINRRVRESSIDNKNRVRAKYGVPFTSRWKVEVQNISRDISWQDLKDFCFTRTRIRPSHAELHKEKRAGTLSCGTESDMKIVLQKLNGAVLNGRSLTVISDVDKSADSHSNDIKPYSERIHKDKHQSEDRTRNKNDHTTKNDQHKDDRRNKHRDIGNRKERQRDQWHGAPSSHRRKDESKVIIHQPNGDKVITERISNIEKDDDHHSDNEQAYFKRDQRSSRRHSNADREGQGGSHKNTGTNLTPSKKKSIHKYGVPVQTKWKIRIENLPSEASWQDLKDLIRPYAEVTYADAHKEKQEVGIVHVGTQEGLRNVISKLNNSDIKGKTVRFIDDSEQEKSTKRGRSDKKHRSRSPHRSSRCTEKGSKTSKSK